MSRQVALRCAGVAGRVWRCRKATRHPSGLCAWHRAVRRLAPRSCAICGPADRAARRAVLQGCAVCHSRTGHTHLMVVDRNGAVIHSEARCDAHTTVPVAYDPPTGTAAQSAAAGEAAR